MYYSVEKILKAEHEVMVDLLVGQEVNEFASGVTCGILSLVDRLLEEEESNGRTNSD